MSQSTALVPTEHASRYLMQLCKHWAHKFTVTFDAAHGDIDFGEGKHVALHADANALRVTLTTENETDDIKRLEQVVADHLARFAFREELVFDWR